MQFFLLTTLNLLAATPLVSSWAWIFPPMDCDGAHADSNKIEGALANITWSTGENDSYTVYLVQQTDQDVTLFSIYNKTIDQPEEGGFIWNITALNLPNTEISAFFMFSTIHGTFSRKFDILQAASESSNTITTSTISGTSTSLSTSAKSLPLVVTNSIDTTPTQSMSPSSPTTLNTMTTSTESSASHNHSSSKKMMHNDTTTIIAIIIAVAFGLSLILLICFCIYKRSKSSKTEYQSKCPMDMLRQIYSKGNSDKNTTPQNNLSSSYEVDLGYKVEMSTPFNAAKSMGSTVLAKSELPGSSREA